MSPNSKSPNCFGRRVLCVGLRSPNLFGCLPVFGLRLGEDKPNKFDAGREVGLGIGEKVAGAKVDWKGRLESNILEFGLELAIGLGENVLGLNVDWNGLLEGDAVGLGRGLGENVLVAKVDGKGRREGLAVGLGLGLLGAKVLGAKEVSNAGVVGLLVGPGLLDEFSRGLVGLGVCTDVANGLLEGVGLGLVGCLPGLADWNGRLSMGSPLLPLVPLPPKLFIELPNGGPPLPPEPPNAFPRLGGGLENPIAFPPLKAPITFPRLPPAVPSQLGTSHGQLQIKFASSNAKPNGHLNS